MRSVADECNAAFWADPCREWVTKNKFPVHEILFGSCADDRMANRRPVGNCGNGFIDITRC